jgi:hypothetical protein
VGLASVVDEVLEVDAVLGVEIVEELLVVHSQDTKLLDLVLRRRVSIDKVGRDADRPASLWRREA